MCGVVDLNKRAQKVRTRKTRHWSSDFPSKGISACQVQTQLHCLVSPLEATMSKGRRGNVGTKVGGRGGNHMMPSAMTAAERVTWCKARAEFKCDKTHKNLYLLFHCHIHSPLSFYCRLSAVSTWALFRPSVCLVSSLHLFFYKT